jgi:S-DNA-T family DNA segregation ATPase FtsK/SpoIIIE
MWRYRSELAPFLVAGAVFLAGWWAHLSTPHWYPYFIVGSAVVAWLLITFGPWLGLLRLADRVYAGVIVFAAGAWVAFAALFGPQTPPLPLVLGTVALILAVPWWADHRRQARARLLRALAAWPDMAQAIGLPGSAIQSVSVDVWGWRAWLRLAYGQTAADVTTRIPAIESALGTVHGAVQVFPARDGKANWCELRVLGTGACFAVRRG